MKLLTTIIISLIFISFTAQSAKVKSLIVAEYRKDSTGLGNYTNLISYNFFDGKLISKDTVYSPPAFSRNDEDRYSRFCSGQNLFIKIVIWFRVLVM